MGEGEKVDLEVIDLYKKNKANGGTKQDFLRAAAQINGVYVPSLYDVTYNDDKTVKAITPKFNAPPTVEKRIEENLDETYYPDKFVVPYIEAVHDRAVQEVFRGCIRGCRFCQAGYIYRPVREKSPAVVNRQARALCQSAGYDEMSLSSLSTSDYTRLEDMLDEMLSWTECEKISLSLPSLRIDNFSEDLMKKINRLKKSGLTFAPEAGTQRLRDVINKNITENDILGTCATAFRGGYTSVKLYFMMGLPTETDQDIVGIADLAQKIVDLYYSLPERPKGKAVNVSISVANFVPKPHTPFQFEPQITREEMMRRQRLLKDSIKSKKITFNYHENRTSFLEGVFARGDRKLGAVIESAYKKGCRFDGWDECFNLDAWLEAFGECDVAPEFYANRTRPFDEITPWDHLDYRITKDFLIREKFNLLEKYARRHQLSSYQITDILSDLADVDDEYTQAFIRELLKNNTLNREQEQLLVSKNDVLFLESYLTPNGYFDASRRFHEVAEHNYILGMAEAKNMTGIEVFKAYVDNTCRDMMTDELLAELILLPESFAVRYVLQKARLSKEQEDFLVDKAPEKLIKIYIGEKELASDAAQLQLVGKHFELARLYFEKYGLRSKAQQTYHLLRKQALEKTPSEEDCP